MTDPLVSIIIPVKNGERDIERCLSAVFLQESEYAYEVIVIDSGSSDNTLQIARKFPVKTVEIEPQDFGHGKTTG